MAPTEATSPEAGLAAPPAREGLIVFALAMSAFVLNLNSNVMGALLPFLREPFGFGGEGDVGGTMLLAAAGFGSAAGAFFVSDVTRGYGQRRVLGASLGLFVVVSLLHVVASSFAVLLTLRALAGVSSGLAYATASAAVADVAPYARRGAVMGRFNAGLFLAIPVGLPLTVLLASRGWWPGTFVLQALCGAIAALLSVRHVPPAPRNPLAARAPLLRNRGVLAVLAATMLHVGSFFTVVQLATTWLDDSGLLPKEQQVWVWVGLGALSVAGSACFGRLADALGKRSFVLVSSAVLVVCMLVLAQEPDVSIMLPTGCVLALAAAARTGPLQALVSGLVPSAQLGALMGLRGFCMQLGVGLFALGAARLGAELGFRSVLQLAAGCQALSYLAIRLGVSEPR